MGVLPPDRVDESVSPSRWKSCPNLSKYRPIMVELTAEKATYGIFCQTIPESMNMIEAQDRRLLTHLQKDGRRSNQDLAEDVGMSSSACWRRVRALEES